MNASARLTTTTDGRVIVEVGITEGRSFQPLLAVGMRRDVFDGIVREYLEPATITPASLADIETTAQHARAFDVGNRA